MERLRYWLSEHGGLVVLAVASLVIAVAYGGYLFPAGPSERLVGTVRAVKLGAGKNTYNRVVYVALGAQIVMVTMPSDACAVGDRIWLERQRKLWGSSLTADPMACNSLRD